MRLGNVAARCAACGGTDFVELDPGREADELAELACMGCEAPTSRGDLIVQIAGEAFREAADRLRGSDDGEGGEP